MSLAGAVSGDLSISLAIGADDAPMVAHVISDNTQVLMRRWDGTAWQDMGAPIDSLGSVFQRIGDIALDAGHSSSANGVAAPMVAWAETGDVRGVIVHRWSGNEWDQVGDLVLAGGALPEHVGLAADDARPALVVTDAVGGFIGRVITAYRFVP